jgi:hypothetical protein
MVLITYRGAKNGGTTADVVPIPHLPLPSEYASTFIIYGALAFIPGEGQRVASLVGWGLVVATFLNLWNPGGSVKSAATVAGTAGASTQGNRVTTPTAVGVSSNIDTGTAQYGK